MYFIGNIKCLTQLKPFMMMIIPPYHKVGEKSLLHEIPVLFNFVTFALSSIQWPACRAEGRIIGFGVCCSIMKIRKAGSQVTMFLALFQQFLMDICPLTQSLHLRFQPACLACVQERDPLVRHPGCFKQAFILETIISLLNFILWRMANIH